MLTRVGVLLALVVLPVAAPGQSPPDSARGGDTLASGARFSGATLRRLPLDDPRQAFTLVPGVVLRSGDIGIGAAPALSIRGSAPGQTGVYVDGAPVRFQTFGTQGIGLAPNAIAEAQVSTGVAPVFISDASGGLITYVTPSGGERLAGQVRWDSDEPFGNGVSVGYNRLEGSVGGPLALAGNLTFHLSTTLQGQRSAYRGMGAADVPLYVPHGTDTSVEVTSGTGTTFVPVPAFAQWTGSCDAGANGGVECQGIRRPMDWSSARRVQGKVQYVYGEGSSVSLTGLGSDLQQRFFPGTLIMDPALYQGRRASSAVGIVNWSHRLRGPLALHVNLSAGRDRDVAGLLTPESDVATRDPYLGIEFETLRFTGTDVFPFPVTDAIVHNVRTNSGLRAPYLNREDLRNRQPYRLNPYGLLSSGWPTEGMDGPISFVDEDRVTGRGALEWRRGDRHQVTFGVDAERTSLSLYQSSLLRQAFMDVTVAQPKRVGVFVGDQIELGAGSAVLDLGVRYDRFTPGGEFPVTPGRIYSQPLYQSQYINAGTDPAVYAAFLADRNIWAPTTTHSALSPRVRIAAAVSPSTSLRFGYGRQVEAPSYEVFFQHANSDLDFTNTNDAFALGEGFAAASLLEFGARSTFASGLVVDAALYRKDLPQYAERIEPFADPAAPGDTINLRVLRLNDAGYGTGVDARLEWRRGEWLVGSAAYSLQRTHTDASGSLTTHAAAAAVSLGAPGGWNEGTFIGALARDLRADLTLRATSGLPYTRLNNTGSGALAPGGGFSPFAIEPPNASRLPWTKRLDLRLTRAVRAGGRDWTVYADLRNALNFRNTIALFAETGDVVNPLNRALTLSSEYANLAGEASQNNALAPDSSIDLSACATWQVPVNCVALTRVERRFGDGDGVYTVTEQARAFNAFYDAFFGPSRFYGSGRTLRMGVELAL